MYRTLLVWLRGFQMFVLFDVVINEPTFPLSHTLLATCGTLLFLWEQTPYSHQARRGTFLTSVIRPIPLSHTPSSKVWYIALQPPQTFLEMLNPNFFRAKTFNIFYVFGCEKFSTSSIRAPIKPRKFPQKHLENPQKHIEFSTSDVFLPLYRPKKEEKAPCLGLSPLR